MQLLHPKRFTSCHEVAVASFDVKRQMTEVRRLARKGLEVASRQTEPGEKNRDEPQRSSPIPLRSGQGHLDLSRLILTPSQTHRISIKERPTIHLSLSNSSGIYREAG